MRPSLSIAATRNAFLLFAATLFLSMGSGDIGSSGNLTLSTNNGTVAVTLDTSQNAVFAGNLKTTTGLAVDGGTAVSNQIVYAHGMMVDGQKTLSTTTNTTTTFFLASSATDTTAGFTCIWSVELNDGTNVNVSEGVSTFAGRNKTGTAGFGASTASTLTNSNNSSGTTTVAISGTTSGTNYAGQVNVQWTVIVPTSVTITYKLIANTAGTVTPQ